MASEIRINILKNRSGLSTVSLTDSGPIFTGIATFTGGVGIAGTLTYEDVTNVDSVGIITAQSGINCGGDLDITGQYLKIENSASPEIQLTDTNASNSLCFIRNSSGNLRLSADNNNAVADTSIRFLVDGGEKVRITGIGSVGIGTDNPDQKLVVQGSGTTILKVENTDDGTAQLTLGNTGSSNLGIQQVGGNTLFKIGGNERMRISSAGHVTKPNNPMFKVNMSSSPAQNSTGWKKIPFNVDTGFYFNIGGHYDTTNYKFTAPVSGFYQFGLNQRIDGGNGNYFRIALWINGADQAGNNYPGGMSIYRDGDGFNYVSLTISCLIKLDANDYVEPYAYSNTDTSWTLQDESQFYGYLVG